MKKLDIKWSVIVVLTLATLIIIYFLHSCSSKETAPPETWETSGYIPPIQKQMTCVRTEKQLRCWQSNIPTHPKILRAKAPLTKRRGKIKWHKIVPGRTYVLWSDGEEGDITEISTTCVPGQYIPESGDHCGAELTVGTWTAEDIKMERGNDE